MDELIRELRQQMAALNDANKGVIDKAVGEKRSLTPEEKTLADGNDLKIADLQNQIADREALITRQKNLATATAKKTGDDKITFSDKNKEFRHAGEQLQAIAYAAKWPTNTDPRLLYQNQVRAAKVREMFQDVPDAEIRANGMQTSIPADGGFFLQANFIENVLGGIFDVNGLIGRCFQIPDNGGGIEIPAFNETSRADGSRFGGVKAYRNKEAASMTGVKPALELIKIMPEELTVMIPVTNRLLYNAAGLFAFIQKTAPSEYTHKIIYEMINGLGDGEMLGWLASKAIVSASKKNGQAAGSFLWENIAAMIANLVPQSYQTACWVLNQFHVENLMKLNLPVGTGGAPLLEKFKLNGIAPGIHELAGLPCYLLEQCPKPGTLGDANLVDLSQYVLSVSPQTIADSSIHVYYVTNETAFRWVWLINGQPAWRTKRTSESDSSKYISPFITLEAR